LSDVFGHSGVVGLAVFRFIEPKRAELDTFLMSCRVIGREAEGAFLHALLRHLEGLGVGEVLASFIPTQKNALAAGFLRAQGFDEYAENQYRWNLAKASPKPASAFPVDVQSDAGSLVATAQK
jgi:predicted enzyme involved in methoxymalonyl-ACP biosynthesis